VFDRTRTALAAARRVASTNAEHSNYRRAADSGKITVGSPAPRFLADMSHGRLQRTIS
jgi:hypothetical protein